MKAALAEDSAGNSPPDLSETGIAGTNTLSLLGTEGERERDSEMMTKGHGLCDCE